MNSSFWAWSQTFCLGVKMRSHGFQASTKCSHPRQPGSTFRTSRTKPLVGHFSGNRGRLSLVATADDLDALTLGPVEESFQGGSGHCADLVPDDHTGNELLPHPFRLPLHLATPTEEAVVGLGLDAPGSHLFGQAMGRGEDKGI